MTCDKDGAAGRWAPCPFLLGAQRNTLLGTERSCVEGSSNAVSIDESEGFYCHRCGQGGKAKTLARLVGGELPAGYSPPPPTPKVDEPGRVAVDEAWAALYEHPAGWADVVHRHLVARGWPAELAQLVEAHPDVLGRGKGLAQVPPVARGLYRAIPSQRGLWVALRDQDGRVRDVAARWTAETDPDSGLKGKRLWGPVRGKIAGQVMLGHLPRAMEAVRNGRPVVFVEGEMDYLAACAVVGTRAAVIGAPGSGSIGKIATLLAREMAALPSGIDEPEVWVVPDVGDLAGQPDHPAYLGGERKMLDAVTIPREIGRVKRALIDLAKIRWCPPLMCRSTARAIHPAALRGGRRFRAAIPTKRKRPKADFEDLARVVDREAVWGVLRSGLTVIHDGDEDWRKASDFELFNACYRLSLLTVIDAANHRVDDKSDAVEWKPAHYTRIENLVMAWFGQHGARWFHDEDRSLVMWRGAMYDVESRAWFGQLHELGNINPLKDGRWLVAKMVAVCWRNRRPALIASPFWAGPDEVRIHLQHDEADTVMRARSGAVDLVDNGARSSSGLQVVQEASLGQVDSITWRPDVTPAMAAQLLYDRAGRWWTVPGDERVMLAAYMVMSLFRHQLRDRPILWLAGESGSGKTVAAETFVACLYGERGKVLANPTNVSISVQSKTLPILVLDNAENSGAGGKRARLERLLLHAATGKQARTKGTKEGGVTSQDMLAMMMVTAIEPPTLTELINRCLMVVHTPEHRDTAFRPGVIGELIRDRSAILSGMARMWSQLLDRLDEVGRLASLVPADHPIGRMRETLGIMAVIGEGLGAWHSRWTTLSAEDLLQRWLVVQGERSKSVQVMGNPILHGLDALLRRYNRVEARGSDGMWQPAVDSDELATVPVFAMAPGRIQEQIDAANEAAKRGDEVLPIHRLTFDPDVAETNKRYGHQAKRVVGFQGTHAEIYMDLVSTMAKVGMRQEFVEAVASAGVLGARAAHIKDRWDKIQITKRSPRRYQYMPVEVEP